MYWVLLFSLNFFLASTSLSQVSSQLGESKPFIGKSGTAGRPSIDGVDFNPAIAGEVKRSSILVTWGASSYEYSQRYPGFEAHSSRKFGLNPKLPIPKFLYKISPRLGVSGTAIPFPVSQTIDVEDIPIVILSQQSLVDIKGEGKVNALADLNIGYAIANQFSVGMRFHYLSYEGGGDLSESSAGEKIASFDVKSETVNIVMGAKFSAPLFSVGILVGVFKSASVTSKLDSQLNAIQEGDANDDGKDSTSSSLNPLRLGLGVRFHPKVYATIDVEYKKVEKGKKRFSIVDMTEKELDAYDTISFYSGAEVRVDHQTDVMFGYFNEPGSIGPGSKGEDGKTGFGFFDLALNLGEPPEQPVWGLAGGIRYKFDRIRLRKRKRGFYRVIFETGLVYSETSIGIDESGEQPGAYLAKRYKIPVKLVYRF